MIPIAAMLLLCGLQATLGSKLVLGAVVALGMLVALLKEPGLGLAGLAALSFTLPLTVGTGSDVSLTPPVALIAALASAWLLESMRSRALRLPTSPATLPLMLFVASALLSLAAGTAYWSPFVPRAHNLLLVQLAQIAIYALSAIVFVAAGALARQPRWLALATSAFFVAASIAVVQWLVPPLFSVGGFSIAAQGNSAMLWAWLGPMAAGQLLFNRRLGRAAKAGLVILLAAALLVVWGRQRTWVAGWLPFTLGLATVVWLRFRRRGWQAALLAGTLMLTAAGLLYSPVFQHVEGRHEVDISLTGRMILIERTLDLVKQHPILGLGPAAYRHYGYQRPLDMGIGAAFYVVPRIASHNNYVDIYAQMGVVGLALFLWFLVSVGKEGWRLLDRYRGDFREGYVVGCVGGLAATAAAMMLIDCLLPFVYNSGFHGFRTSALAWMFLGGLVALSDTGIGVRLRPSSATLQG